MAARQGFTAQISQASEDAKQKLLSHAPLQSKWFSNLNTTCTIKSAPPRTPEVLELLSLKSGWLWKRNEQHVWQARWCCVVPHTFLYYFDSAAVASTGTSSANLNGSSSSSHHHHDVPPPPSKPPPLTAQQQAMLNEAVKSGYGDKPHSGPRTTFNVFTSSAATAAGTSSGNVAHTSMTDGPAPGGNGTNSVGVGGGESLTPLEKATTAGSGGSSAIMSQPPAGIIDLECYTSVHRSTENEWLLELAGDESVNPDLRSFYFFAHGGEQDAIDWTQALLQHRFSRLQDELEAFREVSNGFAIQLQELHCDLDFYKSQLEETQDELYSVRSAAEDARRTCFRLVREALDEQQQQQQQQQKTSSGGDADATATTSSSTITDDATTAPAAAPASSPNSSCHSTLRDARNAYRHDLEAARDLGGTVVPAVQLLSDYVKVLEESCVSFEREKQVLQSELQSISTHDDTRLQELKDTMETKQQEWLSEKAALQQQVSTLQQALAQSQKLADDAQQEVVSTKLEMTMYQNSTKQRLGELLTHKKILKKEVIDLRQKLDEVGSELSLLKHTQKTSLQTAEQERKKSELLERYVERMESQVKVQQSMMEMMSTTGGGAASVNFGFPSGNSVHSFTPRAHHSEAPGFVTMASPGMRGGGVGVGIGPHEQSAATSPRTNLGGGGGGGNASNSYQSEVQREHNELLRRAREMVLEDEANNNISARGIVQVATQEDEEKSHMSELTEDRTQKHFYAQFGSGSDLHGHENSPLMMGGGGGVNGAGSRRRVTPKRLPSYIGVQEEQEVDVNDGRRRLHREEKPEQRGAGTSAAPREIYQDENGGNGGRVMTPTQKLDTIMSSAASVPLQRGGGDFGSRRRTSSGGSSNRSVQDSSASVNSTSKLSVAQRARLEADQRSNSNSVRVKPIPPRRANSESSVIASIGKSLTEVIDHSVLGLPSSSESDELSTTDEERDRQYGDIPHSDTAVSEVSAASTTMSLQERQSLQRAKQLAFLKEHGLIKEESNLRGGAGATPSPKRESNR